MVPGWGESSASKSPRAPLSRREYNCYSEELWSDLIHGAAIQCNVINQQSGAGLRCPWAIGFGQVGPTNIQWYDAQWNCTLGAGIRCGMANMVL